MANNDDKGSEKKSFIGKLLKDLDIDKEDLSELDNIKKKKTNPNIVDYDWDNDNPLKGRRVLITKKGEILRKNYELEENDKVEKQEKIVEEKPREEREIKKPRKTSKKEKHKLRNILPEDNEYDKLSDFEYEENVELNDLVLQGDLIEERVDTEDSLDFQEEVESSEIKVSPDKQVVEKIEDNVSLEDLESSQIEELKDEVEKESEKLEDEVIEESPKPNTKEETELNGADEEQSELEKLFGVSFNNQKENEDIAKDDDLEDEALIFEESLLNKEEINDLDDFKEFYEDDENLRLDEEIESENQRILNGDEIEEHLEDGVGKRRIKEKKTKSLNLKDKFLSKVNKIKSEISKDIEANKKEREKNEVEKETSVKKSKIRPIYIIIPVASILILLLTIVLTSKGTSFAIDNMAQEAILVLDTGDIDEVKSSVVFSGGKSEDYENAIENFLKLYSDDEEFKDYVRTSITSDVENIKKDGNYKSESLVGVEKSAKRYLFLDGYKIKITPLELETESIVEKYVKIGDKNITVRDKTKVIPGIYDIETNFEFLKLNNTVSLKYTNNEAVGYVNVDYTKAEIANENFELNAGDYDFEIQGVDDENLVFVDGKNANTTVGEFNEMDGKNLSSKSSIAVLDKSKMGYGLSDSLALVNAKDKSKFKIKYDNNLMLDNFIGIIKTTIQDDTEAFRNSDINMLSTLGGESLDYASGWINKNIGNNQYYIREYMSFLIDPDMFKMKNTSSLNSVSAYVGGYLSYKEGKFSNDDKNPDLSKLDEYKDKKTGFHFEFDEDEGWYVSLWGTTYRNVQMNSNNLLIKFD